MAIIVLGLVLLMGGKPDSGYYRSAWTFLVGLIVLIYLDMGLSIFRGRDIGMLPSELPYHRRARASIGMALYMSLYLTTMLWLIYGDVIYLGLSVPSYK